MADTKIFDQIDVNMLDAFHQATHTLYSAGYDLAVYLSIISLAIAAILMLIRQEELHNMVSKLLKMALLFGFFFGMMTLCTDWVPKLVSTFMQIGGEAGHIQALDPSSIFDQGFVIGSKILDATNQMGLRHLPTALLASICALFIVLIYAMMAATLVVTLIKAYALIAVGPLIFALGMSDFTRTSVTNYLSKVIGLGLNLLMLYIVIGVGIQMGDGWIKAIEAAAGQSTMNFSDIFFVMGSVLVLYLVVQNVPAFIATISGASGFRDYGQATVAAAMGASAMIVNTLQKGMTTPFRGYQAGKDIVGGAQKGIAGAGRVVDTGIAAAKNTGHDIGRGVSAVGRAGQWAGSKMLGSGKNSGEDTSGAFAKGAKVLASFNPNRDKGAPS